MTLVRTALAIAALLTWLPPEAGAQSAPAPPGSAAQDAPSKLWLVAGGAFSTLRGDCQTCEEDSPYHHAGSALANLGRHVNPRMDVGAEVFWMPMEIQSRRVNTTHIDAIAQFRPWASAGFFVKGGAGMAFVRNWVDGVGDDPIRSKALSVVIGAGWAFRPAARIGLQVFGSQHAAALGDFKTPEGDIQDVMGNFWSFGAGIVIR